VGIRCEKKTKGLETNENEFVNLKVPVDRAGK
jgi:hypothetical protein